MNCSTLHFGDLLRLKLLHQHHFFRLNKIAGLQSVEIHSTGKVERLCVERNQVSTGFLARIDERSKFSAEHIVEFKFDVRRNGQAITDARFRVKWIRIVLIEREGRWRADDSLNDRAV
jgi:hypothetical protein